MRSALFAAAASLVFAAGAAAQSFPLIDARTIEPRLMIDMRYAGSSNFVGRPIAGYDANVCLLTREAATALAKAHAELAASGLGFKLFDCYRPQRAVNDFVAWAADPKDQKHKRQYYPRVDKSELFARGYIARRSGHSRGSTVDLTIVDMRTRRALDMGAPWDLFDPRSAPTYQRLTTAQRANRLLLRNTMMAHGFKPLAEEWWHFTLRDEPYPDTYFDVPVTR